MLSTKFSISSNWFCRWCCRILLPIIFNHLQKISFESRLVRVKLCIVDHSRSQCNFFFFSFRLLLFDNFFCVFLQFCFCFSVIAVYRVSNRCECTSACKRVCVVVVIVIAVSLSLESVCKCTRISIKRNELRSSIVVLCLIIVIYSLSFSHLLFLPFSSAFVIHSVAFVCEREKRRRKCCDLLCEIR